MAARKKATKKKKKAKEKHRYRLWWSVRGLGSKVRDLEKLNFADFDAATVAEAKKAFVKKHSWAVVLRWEKLA